MCSQTPLHGHPLNAVTLFNTDIFLGTKQFIFHSASCSTLTCRALCASMVQHPTHFPSTVESSRAACSPQSSLGSSSRCYSPMLSKTPRTGSTYTHVPMVNSTTWPGSEPKPRSGTLPRPTKHPHWE